MMTTEELEKMMADPEAVRVLRKVLVDKQEVTEQEADVLRASPYIKTYDDGKWGLTNEGRDALGDDYSSAVYRDWEAERIERCRRGAQEAVNHGYIEVVDDLYHVTERGRWLDCYHLVQSLKDKRWGAPCFQYAPYEGLKVGEEHERRYHLMGDQKWWKVRKKLLDALPENEKRLLGLPALKPLNKSETELLKMIHDYCQSVKAKEARQ